MTNHKLWAAAVVVLVGTFFSSCKTTPSTSTENSKPVAGESPTAADPLLAGFVNPPDDAKPRVWWHWVNGNISKEGITADLEAMKRVGIGGAQILNVAPGNPPGPVKFDSPAWWDAMRFAARECDRLGLELTVADCAGWSESGGTWVTPEQSMQKLTWSETDVTGPAKFSEKLPQPPTEKDFYRDVRVLAFPTPAGEAVSMSDQKPKVTCSADGADVSKLIDGKRDTRVEFDVPTANKPQWIQVEFAQPYPARLLSVLRDGRAQPQGHLEVSDDGQTWREVCKLAFGRSTSIASNKFPDVSARFYKLVMTASNRQDEKVQIAEFGVSNDWKLDQWQAKAGFIANEIQPPSTQPAPQGIAIAQDKIIDLSDKLGPDGSLAWDIPQGNWTIVRFGHTSTGKTISPAPAEAVGLECDKMNRDAVTAHFNAHVAKIAKEFGDSTGKSFQNVLMDSWEARCQNWTPKFADEFKTRRGYDPLPYLPAMTGRIVGDVQTTERFLWDVRRTIADLIAENHYGLIQELCHKTGLKLQAEAPGTGLPTIAEAFQCKQFTDIPMGEFWVGKDVNAYAMDCKETASAAHIQGATWASAESFTAETRVARWTNDPYSLKAIGDLHFASGINRFVFHRYAHQPWLDRVPGETMGPWGTHLERTVTWWEQGAAWIKYLSRCQHMLSAGQPVADVCYYYGEDVPNRLQWRDVPAGYDFDGCGKDALMQMSEKNGKIVLPSGVSYRVLVLANQQTMTPQVAKKLLQLASAGATIVGPMPTRSPSLSDYPNCDEELARIVAKIWGRKDVFTYTSLADVLKEHGIAPDFVADAPKIAWIHRGDSYFISNQSDTAVQVNCTFRQSPASGVAPQFWYPDTGKVEQCAVWSRTDDGRITVPVSLDPSGSVFVVFREVKAPSVQVVYQMQPAATRTIDGPWEVRFPPGWDAPASASFDKLVSWTDRPEDGIKYFSGTATYVKQIELSADGLAAGRQLWLDLGRVKNLAQVKVNGQDVGVLWKPPFRAEITSVLKPGPNTIEIAITNLWPNRLIGDESLPEDKRHTWSGWHHYTKDSPLLESGLLGPVTIQTAIIQPKEKGKR